MKILTSALIANLFPIFVVGCSSVGGTFDNCRFYAGQALPKSDIAILELGRSRESILRLIDGEPPSYNRNCNKYRIEFRPGQHTIHFFYLLSYSVLGPGGRDPASITFDMTPGIIYDLVVERSVLSWTYTCRIENKIDNSVIAEVEDCRNNRGKAWIEILRAHAQCGNRDWIIKLVNLWRVIARENEKEAYFWCALVEKKYNWVDAQQCKTGLREIMSKTDLELAQKKAIEWKPNKCSVNLF